MAFEHEFPVSRRERDTAAQRAADKFRLAARTRLINAYRKTFVGGDGQLTPAARLIVADIARRAQLGRYSPGASDAELREREGARGLALHILWMMDAAALEKASRQLKEIDDE